VRRRLPPAHRDLSDTDDLVQNTLVKVVRNLDGFSAESGAGLQHYLRTALRNAIRDEIKKSGRRPAFEPLDWLLPSDRPSPLHEVETRERLARYEKALARLDADERDAVIARLELGFTHEELASSLGKATPDAARKLCRKAIARLLTLMGPEGES
jgi:RNA polymerase sigma factor (sigma-70 family)